MCRSFNRNKEVTLVKLVYLLSAIEKNKALKGIVLNAAVYKCAKKLWATLWSIGIAQKDQVAEEV